MAIEALIEQTLKIIQEYPAPLLIAFSGGVDSSVVAKLATKAVGPERALCVAARSESNTEKDIDLCRQLASSHGLNLEVIEYSELAIPNYAENPANRCFFCKDELYTRLDGIAERRGVKTVLDGSNADDVGDYRPGLEAVRRHAVRSPLRESGVRKAEVREIARFFGLPNHNKPSSPCLSSRIPYGETITKEKLERVAKGEEALRTLGFKEFRVRCHEDLARVEVPSAEMERALELRERIVAELRMAGFTWISLDLTGFRSGGLNAVLDQATLEKYRSSG